MSHLWVISPAFPAPKTPLSTTFRSKEIAISYEISNTQSIQFRSAESTAKTTAVKPAVELGVEPAVELGVEPAVELGVELRVKDKERSKEKEIKENNNIACVKEKSASAQGEILNGKDKFVAPEWNEVWAYALTRGATAEEAQKFYAYYSMNGWKNRGVPLENWKAALGYWLLNVASVTSFFHGFTSRHAEIRPFCQKKVLPLHSEMNRTGILLSQSCGCSNSDC